MYGMVDGQAYLKGHLMYRHAGRVMVTVHILLILNTF